MVIVNDDLKVVLERTGAMCSKDESIINLCMLGLMKHNLELIEDARRISKTIHDEENELLDQLRDLAHQQETEKNLIKSLISVVGHIEMATDVLDGMLHHITVKIKEGILFGEKAVNEIRHLFKETLDVLKTAEDAIKTKNEVLWKYISEKYDDMEQTVRRYSEEHEERLITGLCQPKNASLYLNIVDSQVKVVWHVKQAIDRYFQK